MSEPRTALLTGAGGGLGTAFALRLAAAGRRLALADLHAPEQAAAAVRAAGGEARALAADLSTPAGVAALAEAVEADILVNAAADLRKGRIEDVDAATWRQIHAVNADAPYLLARALAPGMAARGFGRIVNVISNTVWNPPDAGFTAYVSSKGALLGLTRALAVELGPHGITVNALAPGLTRTPKSNRDFPEAFFAEVRAQQSVPRTLEPEDIAHGLAYLTADEAAGVTGQALRVDGGLVVL